MQGGGLERTENGGVEVEVVVDDYRVGYVARVLEAICANLLTLDELVGQ